MKHDLLLELALSACVLTLVLAVLAMLVNLLG